MSKFTFDFVNFDDEDETLICDKKKYDNNYNDYDKTTTEFYRIKRLFNIDPISDEKISPNMIFKFNDKWDPLTGNRMGIDEIGPLSFNAFNLYKFYIKNRFNGLWTPPYNDNTGFYQGYYGDCVGAGISLNINNRGYFPEKYLFRLPIVDCYLSKNHNLSLVTMGPMLTDLEITEIDNIISNNILYKNFPKLILIKKWYDKAISDNLDLNKLKNKYKLSSDREAKDKYNRKYVDKLVNIKVIL
jgi:hypothetical protein